MNKYLPLFLFSHYVLHFPSFDLPLRSTLSCILLFHVSIQNITSVFSHFTPYLQHHVHFFYSPFWIFFSFVFLHCFLYLSFLFLLWRFVSSSSVSATSLRHQEPDHPLTSLCPMLRTVPRYCYFPVCWLSLFCEAERLLQVSTNQMENGWHEQNVKSSLVASGEILHSKLTNCRGFKECMIGQANGLAFSEVIHQNIFLPFRKAGYLDNSYYCVFAQLYSVICNTCEILHWGSQLIKS